MRGSKLLAFLGLAAVLTLVLSGPTDHLASTRADEKAKLGCDSKTPRLSLAEQEKAIREWARSLAVQAATYGAPTVAMYNLRATVAFGDKAKAAPGEIWRLENITTPKIAEEAGYVTPNVNTIYGFGFLDLGHQPYILSAPDSEGRYYMVQIVDMWTNAFAYVGGVATGYKGGKFVLVGPGWNGSLPPDVKRIDCPTRWIELQPRVHVKNEADLAGAQEVLRAITVRSLMQSLGGPVPKAPAYSYETPKVNPKVASSQMQFEDPLQFWSIFSASMNENPPPVSEINAVLPQFKYLGIELGKPWKRENVNPRVLEEMKRAAQEIGPMMNNCLALLGRVRDGWIIPPPNANVGRAGADYLSRGCVAVFGLTANTVEEAIYFAGLLDADRQPLTGKKRYTLTFKEPMLYAKSIPPGFWSLTMYDNLTRLTVPNSINRYSLGSDDNLKKNEDGSFTIYVQQDSPGKEKEPNWLPAPAAGFYLVLRNYAPVPELAKALQNPATFQGPPPVVPIGGGAN